VAERHARQAREPGEPRLRVEERVAVRFLLVVARLGRQQVGHVSRAVAGPGTSGKLGTAQRRGAENEGMGMACSEFRIPERPPIAVDETSLRPWIRWICIPPALDLHGAWICIPPALDLHGEPGGVW
jgi:hypothetical protein